MVRPSAVGGVVLQQIGVHAHGAAAATSKGIAMELLTRRRSAGVIY